VIVRGLFGRDPATARAPGRRPAGAAAARARASSGSPSAPPISPTCVDRARCDPPTAALGPLRPDFSRFRSPAPARGLRRHRAPLVALLGEAEAPAAAEAVRRAAGWRPISATAHRRARAALPVPARGRDRGDRPLYATAERSPPSAPAQAARDVEIPANRRRSPKPAPTRPARELRVQGGARAARVPQRARGGAPSRPRPRAHDRLLGSGPRECASAARPARRRPGRSPGGRGPGPGEPPRRVSSPTSPSSERGCSASGRDSVELAARPRWRPSKPRAEARRRRSAAAAPPPDAPPPFPEVGEHAGHDRLGHVLAEGARLEQVAILLVARLQTSSRSSPAPL